MPGTTHPDANEFFVYPAGHFVSSSHRRGFKRLEGFAAAQNGVRLLLASGFQPLLQEMVQNWLSAARFSSRLFM